MYKTTLFVGLLLCCSLAIQPSSYGQSKIFDLGFEFQAYPTGLIPGLRLETGFADQHALHLRVGYNVFDHQDYGVQDDETGDGYGFTFGYKYYFKPGFERWFLGIKNDIWWNAVSWKDIVNGNIVLSGKTNITVVQPTFEAGFAMKVGSDWFFSPSLAFGYEVNVQTKGLPTGEGPIILLGFTFGRRW